MFREGPIQGVKIRRLRKHSDDRGWLMELFRIDELDKGIIPAMSYISLTKPGVARGPHEHHNQTDYFCFIGPSNFKVFLWDNRKDSPTYGNRMTVIVGEDNPSVIIVPEGVVHGYKNIGDREGPVINCPNRLFKGYKRRERVDEVRYETRIDSSFKME